MHHVIRADGAFELAFHRPDFLDVQDELRFAQSIGLVEDLPADRAAGGQALLGQHHPGFFDLFTVDEHGRTAAFERVGDAGRIKLVGNFAGFLEVEAREQQFLAAGIAAQHDDAQAAAHEGHDDKRRSDPHTSRPRELRNQAFGHFCGGISHERPEKSACVAICD